MNKACEVSTRSSPSLWSCCCRFHFPSGRWPSLTIFWGNYSYFPSFSCVSPRSSRRLRRSLRPRSIRIPVDFAAVVASSQSWRSADWPNASCCAPSPCTSQGAGRTSKRPLIGCSWGRNTRSGVCGEPGQRYLDLPHRPHRQFLPPANNGHNSKQCLSLAFKGFKALGKEFYIARNAA